MPSIRQEKVGSLIQKELGRVFQEEGRMLFPGLFITVTVVRMSPDLGLAKVYLSFFTKGDKTAALESVKAQASRIRGSLGSKVGKQLRVVPSLNFYLDDSLDLSEQIDQLLKG